MPAQKDVRAAINAVRKTQESLNRQADSLTDRLRGIEKALREAKVRVSAAVHIAGGGLDGDGTYLTWRKLRNRWCLVIQDQIETHDSFDIHSEQEALAAELRLRKLAAHKVAELVVALGDAAKAQAAELRSANEELATVLDALDVDPNGEPDFSGDDIPF